MAMKKAAKAELGQVIGSELEKASGIILAEYRGLTVEEVTNLRTELRKSDAIFKVTKNRVVKKAIDNGADKYGPIKDDLVGPVGIVYAFGDSAQAAKTALEFGKSHEAFKVKAGLIDESRVGVDQLKAISELPSKDVLMGQLVGSLVAPHRGLLGVLNGVSRQLVQVINAIKDTKS